MKHIPLYCLAAASMALSFFFEHTPARSTSSSSALITAEASLFSFTDDEEDKKSSTLTSDSAAYDYYDQALGVHLARTENKDLLRTVLDWIGTPYRYGSNSKKGTDCSGFVTRVYKEVYGITLERSSHSMFNSVKRVEKDNMETGDLVFFRRGPGQPIYHVGIYLKDGKFAHSACNGGVMVSSLQQQYYHRNFYAAGRVETN
ncbi:NlpC/P60 family protein [Hymenobacter tibetensis]|uniref:NlpC/P60 family protein n=1 Tax=Hymenobacter tibetensis TaxID=497967 RepID=A0ABY4D0K9_9BACT|nr:NlpC/P60 family protein [Hymenobacter tibetensis]UOG75399.1 NlpC/P60 family protein [Hymenobacter tibetensis]